MVPPDSTVDGSSSGALLWSRAKNSVSGSSANGSVAEDCALATRPFTEVSTVILCLGYCSEAFPKWTRHRARRLHQRIPRRNTTELRSRGQRIVLQETNLDESVDVWPSIVGERIVLTNSRSQAVDEDDLGERLSRFSGITTVRVGVDSRVRSLRFLRQLPRVDRVIANGRHLETLEGIEAFAGRSLDVDTGVNKRRILEHLRGLEIQYVSVAYSMRDDLLNVGSMASAQMLDLFKFPAVPFSRLASASNNEL